jgi:hypothetical protein
VEPIVVPAPPKASFNKDRPVSDLLRGQLKHFQHVARKQGITIDAALASDLQTEGGAARYIAEITRAIRSQSRPRGVVVPFATGIVPIATGVVPIAVGARKRAAKASGRPDADRGLAIAAAASPSSVAAGFVGTKSGKTSGSKSSSKSGRGKKP